MGYSPRKVAYRRNQFIFNLSTKLRLLECVFWSHTDRMPWPNSYEIERHGTLIAESSSPAHCVVKAAKAMELI